MRLAVTICAALGTAAVPLLSESHLEGVIATKQWPFYEPADLDSLNIEEGRTAILGATATSCDDRIHEANVRMINGLHRKCETSPGLRVIINAFDAPVLWTEREGEIVKAGPGGMSDICRHPVTSQLPELPSCVIGFTRVVGFKMRFFKWVLIPSLTDRFDAVWMFDNDLDVDGPRFDVEAAVKIMQEGLIAIAQPVVQLEPGTSLQASTVGTESLDASSSLHSDSGEMYAALGQPLNSTCRAAKVLWVENQTPIIQTAAWRLVHNNMISLLDDELYKETDWGPDGRWCRLIEVDSSASFPNACAVLAPIIYVHDADTIAHIGSLKGSFKSDTAMGKRVCNYMRDTFPRYATYASGEPIGSQANHHMPRFGCVLPA